MTSQETLSKAILKAVDNGWDGGSIEFYATSPGADGYYLGFPRYLGELQHMSTIGILPEGWVLKPRTDNLEICRLIFCLDFAKALWGYEPWSVDPTGWHLSAEASKREEQAWFLEAWQFHIQQMVILPDSERTRYLGEHL